MKILRFCMKTPPLKGGMEAHIYHLTKEQLNEGHEVTVVFNSGDKISENDLRFSKVRFYKMKPQFVGIILFGLTSIFYLLYKRKKYDIIHLHGDWSFLLIGKLSLLLGLSKKIAFTFHGGIKNNFSHQKFLPYFVAKVTVVFATGYESYLYLKKYNDNTFFQPSGVNPYFFERRSDKKPKFKYDIISVANFFPVKNQKFILEIAKLNNNFQFVLVGDGPTKMGIEQEIKNQNIKNVTCLGFLGTDQIVSLLLESKLFLLTSIEEGTPTSMMEAITLGIPIIISDVGGISNFITANNGSVQKEFDPKLYSQKIKEYLRNDMEYEKIREYNFNFSNRFKWSCINQFITSKYE